MDISINGKTADITLESEQTLGEVLSGLDSWLKGSGFSLCGLELDGEPVQAEAIPGVFEREIKDICRLNINTGSRFQLLSEALEHTYAFLEAWETAMPGEREALFVSWERGAAASFLSDEDPQLFDMIVQSLKRGDTSVLRLLVTERRREIQNPRGEFSALAGTIAKIIKRLEDLPLDIQTGKDGQAAETVTLFSNAAEKLFRVFMFLRSQDSAFGELSINGIPIDAFLDEFSTALKELLAAYGNKDSVLVGDLAEYELAPRLHTFYEELNALCSGAGMWGEV
ncbi:MAG: hypothetical protein LBG76_06100 [Treponema sp.]|jgi:hypothetical protein|nr:hypothetical protein [Treponema sp.]